MSELVDLIDLFAANYSDALSRAETLPESVVAEIAELLDSPHESKTRKTCYTILDAMARSQGYISAANLAVSRIPKERTHSDKLEALSIISSPRVSGIQDCENVIDVLTESRKLMIAGLRALGSCTGAPATMALVGQLHKHSKNREIAQAAAYSLARMCDACGIEQLLDAFKQIPRKRSFEFVLIPLVFATARHPSKKSTDLFITELSQTRLRYVGWAILNYLAAVAPPECTDIVVSYLHKCFRRLKRPQPKASYNGQGFGATYSTDIDAAIAYLSEVAPMHLTQFEGQYRAWAPKRAEAFFQDKSANRTE